MNALNGAETKNTTNPIIVTTLKTVFLIFILLYANMPSITGVNIIDRIYHMQSIKGTKLPALKLNNEINRYISRTVRKNP